MTFTNDFEQLLDEYNIDVSERTRRMIRRNMGKNVSERTKRYIRRNIAKDTIIAVYKPNLFLQFVYWVWSWIYFVLSLIFKITLGIMAGAVWLLCYFLKVAFEIYVVLLIVHVTTVLMKQNLPN